MGTNPTAANRKRSPIPGARPPWKPGESGNLSGRPKLPPEIAKRLNELTPEAIERLAFWMRSTNPKASVAATVALLDRGLGKPAQSVDIGGDLTHTLADLAQVVAARRNGDSNL